MRILNNIFSLTNIGRNYKLLIIFGFKFKFKLNRNKFILKKDINKLVSYVEQMKYMLDSCCDITQCKPAVGTFREIQLFKTKVLKYILQIFNDNNITYWIDGGTLLGARRHKGFVPWDDDIDIATDRENYNKMIEVLTSSFKSTGLSFDFGQAKTGFYMKIYFYDFDITDVFVYDYSNNPCSKEKLYDIWINSKAEFYFKYTPNNLWNGKIKFERVKNDIFDYYKKFGLVIENSDKNFWLFKGFDAATKNHTCNIFSVDCIFPLQKIKFEDLEVWAPNDIHTYLSTVNSCGYGDYMKFPPLSAAHVYLSDEYENDEFINKLKYYEIEFDKLINGQKTVKQ